MKRIRLFIGVVIIGALSGAQQSSIMMVKRSVFSPMLGTGWIVCITLLLRRASNMANRKQFISIALI